MEHGTEIQLPDIDVNLQRLGQALVDRGLLEKSLSSMSRDEIMDLCKIVTWSTVDSVPF